MLNREFHLRRHAETTASVLLLLAGSLVFTVFFLLMFNGLYDFTPLDPNSSVYLASDHFARMQAAFIPDEVFRQWRALLKNELLLGAYASPSTIVGLRDGVPEQVTTLGVTPEITDLSSRIIVGGRGFRADDRGTHRIIVSEEFWRSYFGRRAFVSDQHVNLDHQDMMIVGVFTNNSVFPDLTEQPDVLTFLDTTPYPGSIQKFHVLLRSKSDQRASAYDAKLNTIQSLALANLPPWFKRYSSTMSFSLTPVRDELNRDRRRMLLGGSCIGAIILLLTAAGVGCIILTRIITRTQEVHIRRLYGASRFQSRMRLLRYSSLLAMLGSGSGLVCGLGAYLSIRRIVPTTVLHAPALGISLDGIVILIALHVFVGANIAAIPFLPVFDEGSISLGSIQSSSSKSSMRLRIFLGMIVSIAISSMLVLGSLAFFEGFQFLRLSRTSPGFSMKNIYFINVSADLLRSARLTQSDFRTEMRDILSGTPGISQIAFTGAVPGSAPRNVVRILPEGVARVPENDPAYSVSIVTISDSFLQTTQIPLVIGEFPSRQWAYGGILTNESGARQFFSSPENALGKSVKIPQTPADCCRIAGVLKDFDNNSLGHPPQPEFFMPEKTLDDVDCVVLVHYEGADARGALGRAATKVNASLPVNQVRSLSDEISSQVAPQRFLAFLSAFFSFAGLGLACAEIYGVVFYTLRRHRRDAAIRFALGAPAVRIYMELTKPLYLWLAGGMAVGMAVSSLALYRAMPSLGFIHVGGEIQSLVGSCLCLSIAIFGASVLAASSFFSERLIDELHER